MNSEGVLLPLQALVEPAAVRQEHAGTDEYLSGDTSDLSCKPISDENLLEAVGRGSKEAVGLLFRRHGRVVFNVSWRILRDESEADDLRQEVFLYIFEHAKQYDSRKSTAVSWIVQITYRRAIDRRRYLSFRQHYKLEALDEQTPGHTVQEVSTDQLDGIAILDKLRGQLTSDQQQTLELHFFEGYSFREIADKTRQPIGNVRHHYYRALERLRSNLFPKKRA
jgi:RNA polymerase sigma-70 factor (ECF subfamily)